MAAAPTPLAEVAHDMDKYSARNLQYVRSTWCAIWGAQHVVRNTAIGNMTDLAAVTVPRGSKSVSLPEGLMIRGISFDEAMVMRVGRACQLATDWRRRWSLREWRDGFRP